MSGHPLGVYANRQDPVQVLEELKRAAVEHLGRVPDGLYQALEAQARESAQTASPIARRDQDNALMALRQRNATYVMRFREIIAENFDGFRALPAVARRPAAQLDLVEDSQLQFHVAGQRLADAIALRHAPALQVLDRRLEALSEALCQNAAANPIGPVQLAGAFGQTFRDTFLPDALRPLLFEQYEHRLGLVLGELYARINTVLAASGYGTPSEAQQALQAQDSQHARRERIPEGGNEAGQAAGDGHGHAAGGATGIPDASNDASTGGPALAGDAGDPRQAINELHQLLRAARRQLGGSGGTSAATSGIEGQAGTAPSSGASRRDLRPAEVVSVASLLQSEPPEAYARALSGEMRLADAIRSELSDGARRLGLDPKDTQLGEGEQDAVDFVGLLFESLFKTHSMLQRSRRLYARLVLPYVKVALIDENVFVERQHPARRLLDAITEACEGNDGATPQDRELLKHAAGAVHRVVADFNEDLAVFELATSELEALLQQQRLRVDAIERRAAEAVHGRERLLQARLQANAAVARRLAQVPVTAIVGDFLVDYWQHHVLQTLLRDGLDSKRHRDALALGEAMVEADRVAALGHGPSVADLLISLQPDIAECLSSSGLDQSASREWMAGLVRALARPDMPRALHELPEPPQAEEDAGSLQLVRGIDAHDFEPAVAERMRRLKPGEWVRLSDQAEEPVPAKVAWISPLTKRYLLVNRRGSRVLVASAEQLAAMEKQGRLHVGAEQAPFDAAMQQLRSQLDKAVGQH